MAAKKSFGKSMMQFGNAMMGCGCGLTLLAVVVIVLLGAFL